MDSDMSVRYWCAAPYVFPVEPYTPFNDTAHGSWINPVLLRQHALRKCLLDIILKHWNNGLLDDGAMIQSLCDEVNRRTVKAHTRLERAPVG
jgi:hypothetical protein